MDPYSFGINTTNELRLRRHLREVLLPYVRTHLTSDYVAFTEGIVEELLLQTLEYVPMADATSFLPPIEPFEVLMRSLHSLDLTLPEERWATPSEHVRYLKNVFPPPPRPQDLQTERCWLEDDHYDRLSLLCRPMASPVLSKRSTNETPKFGSARSRASIPRTKSALSTFLDLIPVPVQTIDELPPPLLDDVLDLRLKLDLATSARLRPFLQSVSARPMKRKSVDCFEDTPNIIVFLNHNSPLRCPPSLDSPPLFPRVAQRDSGHRGVGSDTKNNVNNPLRSSDLAHMLKAASPELMDDEDSDVNTHHMEAVNGWATLTYSSPPPPSLHSSDGSEADGLWDMSPPGTPATSLMAVKMGSSALSSRTRKVYPSQDEVEIPRTRKFGHKNTLVNESTNDSGAAALLTATNSPGFFITSFISAPTPMAQAQKPITPRLESVGLGVHFPPPLSPVQSTSNSLLGQPPSSPGKQAREETFAKPTDYVTNFEDQQFDDAVASIYISTPQDPLSYVVEEKLDDKDIMLMDVPTLPPPTTHPKDLILFPEGIKRFVAPKGELEITSHGTVAPMAFLRPVKGIKPLALDLSWRPFNFGKTVPTDEEVTRIAKPIQLGDEMMGYRNEQYEKTVSVLLDLDIPSVSAEHAHLTIIPKLPRGCEELGTSPTRKRAEDSGHVEYLLTQRERTRASGANFTLEVEAEVQCDVGIEQYATPRLYSDSLVQRKNVHQNEERRGSWHSFDPTEYGSRSRVDSGTFDDSGIDIIDNNFGQFSTSEFGIPFLLSHPTQDDLLHDVDVSTANKESNDAESGNKENVPPGDVEAEYEPNTLASQYDWSGYFELPESETFEPLSFASQSQAPPSEDLTVSTAQELFPQLPSARRDKRPNDHIVSASEHERTNSRVTKKRKLDNLVPASSKDLFSTFIGLRNQATSSLTLKYPETGSDTSTPHETLCAPEQILPRATPDDVFDQHTVRLPEPWIPSAAIHRYLASITLIQKRALVRELQGHYCRVDLVERYDLGGTDVIVDPDSSVLFISLLALPAHLEPAVERISRESWRYLNLLVVLEAFPSAQSYRADCSRDDRPVPYAYTPPIRKAVKKLRRNLGIAEGCGTMDPRCRVTWAFANDVGEAAKFVRCFGEEACVISKERGCEILWDERAWLDDEERKGESDLARVHSMNAFAAFMMLYDRSLETILDLSPETRLADFGQLLGEERMMALNAVIESRTQQIAPVTAHSVADLESIDSDLRGRIGPSLPGFGTY